jgi:inorganic phosphate transporter, PiT family
MISAIVIVIIGLALLFDFLNGFHDAANAIATVVVTRVLTPLQAVALSGLANFAGYFIFGVAIANTVGNGIIVPAQVTLNIILAALVGAILWNIMTWILGLPTSSSHALIGGMVGSALVAAGTKALVFTGILKIFAFIFIAPLLGMIGAMLFTTAILFAFRNSRRRKSDKWFRRLQLVSATVYSVSHGTNDAQKTMGVIALTLLSAGMLSKFSVPLWVVLSCYSAICIGTFFGGWRIVKTMGTNITKIRAREGFCAETSSGVVLMVSAHLGVPVSTTHVISGSIMGVGAIENARGVRWQTARRIIWSWLLTIPISALVGAMTYFLLSLVL